MALYQKRLRRSWMDTVLSVDNEIIRKLSARIGQLAYEVSFWQTKAEIAERQLIDVQEDFDDNIEDMEPSWSEDTESPESARVVQSRPANN
jgi:hypothetical protein